MSTGKSPKSGWASFRPRRKQKLSRPSASRQPLNPNNKVSCERLARLVSLSLDVDVRWKFVGKSGTTVKRRKYVDSKISPKFRFARGVGAGSACNCRFQQGWEWGARVLWTAVQRDELFRGLRMQYFRLRAQEGVRFFWLQALNTGKTQLGQVHPRTTPTRQLAVACKVWPWRSFRRRVG